MRKVLHNENEVSRVTIMKAIAERVEDLRKEKEITHNKLAIRAGVTPSTVYSMMKANRKDLSAITVKSSVTDWT